jgi:predicted metal-dependent enzyme (double-stranded beta helix superfamily)
VTNSLAVSAESVSFVELKALVKRLFREDSTLRSLVLSEPDFLERSDAMVRLKAYVKLLYLELGLR